MLVIRLARTGRKKYPTYRIVAAESSRAVTGKFVAILGHYNPHTKELVIKKDETEKYIGNGAQPSNSVIRLLQQEKVKMPDWVQFKSKNKSSKKEQPAEEASAKPESKDEGSSADEEARVATTAQEQSEDLDTKTADQPKDDEGPSETAASEEAVAESAQAASDAAAEVATEKADDDQTA